MTAATPGPCHKEIQSRLRAIAQIIHRATTTPGCERPSSDDVGWAAMGLTARPEFREASLLDIEGTGSETVLVLVVSSGKFAKAHGKSSAGVAGYLSEQMSHRARPTRPALPPLIAEPALAFGLMTNVSRIRSTVKW